MIDQKSRLVLKILAKECSGGSYKIVEIPDIIMSMPKHFRLDSESIKHILTYLERQNMISIKYDEDDVYCLAVLPYGFEILENENQKKEVPKKDSYFTPVLISFFSALFGTVIGIIICYFLFKLF